jgi:putative NADH-flavin reductase
MTWSSTSSVSAGAYVLVSDAVGLSTISAEDHAAAFVDELCNGQHLGTRFSMGF